MRKGMEVMSLLYLRGAETDGQTDRQTAAGVSRGQVKQLGGAEGFSVLTSL